MLRSVRRIPMSGNDTKPHLTLFLCWTFGASVALSVLVALTGGRASPYLSFAPVAMFIPAIGVLLSRIIFEDRTIGVRWTVRPFKMIPVALFVFPLVIHLFALPAVYFIEGRIPWVEWLTPSPDGLFHTPAERGWGVLDHTGLAVRLVANTIIGLIVVSVLAFFEEGGWRAWLLPRLAQVYSVRAAICISALIWAAWHLPFAWSGIHQVPHVSTPALSVIAPLGHFGAGLVLAWLWLSTNSIILVSIAHGSLNNWGQYAFKFMETSGRNDTLLLVAVNVGLLFLGLFVLRQVPQDAPPEVSKPRGNLL